MKRGVHVCSVLYVKAFGDSSHLDHFNGGAYVGHDDRQVESTKETNQNLECKTQT